MSVTTPTDTAWIVRPARARALARAEAATSREAAFASRGLRIEAAVATSRGLRHAENEDCHSALDGPAPLFVVADGVGGGALASRASRELVSRLHATLDAAVTSPDTVRAALMDADRAIRRSIANRSEATGAATVALCKGTGPAFSRWLVAWVGDCRVYRLKPARDPSMQLLTADDSYRRLREEPPPGATLDDPARMVGNGAIDVPNVCHVRLGAGEMLVLCSDGIHKHAAPDDMGRLLAGSTPLARRCEALIDFARERGSEDDATVLVVKRGERNIARAARLTATVALVALLAAAAAWLVLDSTALPHDAAARLKAPQPGGST